jgi:acyl-coenzyme A thioesterase PaaI-like protein
MAASTEPKDAPMFTEKTLPILADGYNNLPPHVFAGFRIVQNDDGDWVGRLEVDDNTGRGGYLHGGLTYAFLDVISSYLLEAHVGPWFYGRTIDTQASMLRAPRIGTIVEFRGQVDRVAGGIAQTRAEAWALLPDGPKLVATGSASKAIMDRRERPRIGDIDLAKVT